jgi:hypothetical protein
VTVKDHIRGFSSFLFYCKGELYYETADTGFVYRVPIDDTGDATFDPVMKSLIMMRWIRKEMESRNG